MPQIAAPLPARSTLAATGRQITVVRRHPESGDLVASDLAWGLIPRTAAQRPDITPIHARAETLSDKPMFRDAYHRRRGVVAVDTYEQKDARGKRHVIQRADGEPMAIAAIWDNWKNPRTGIWERTCATITVAANADLASIHDRMPLIIEKPDLQRWLGLEEDPRDLLTPSNDGLLSIVALGSKRLRRS